MPAPPLMDLGTGMNTQETIRQLIEYESQPILRIERENGELVGRISLWEKLRNFSRDLADKSRDLSSSIGAFSKRTFFSSDTDAITGTSLPAAKAVKHQIQVEQLATIHQLNSDPLDINKKIGKGEFTITQGTKEKLLKFEGGNPLEFKDFIANELNEFANISINDVGENKIILSIESKKSGKEGELVFKDPNGVLGNAGLFSKKKKQTPIDFSPTDLSIAREGPKLRYTVLEEGKKLRFTEGSLQLDLKEFLKSRKEGMLRLNVLARRAPEGTENEGASKTETLNIGPEINVEVGDVELMGPNLDRSRKVPLNKDSNETQQNQIRNVRTEVAIVFEHNGKLEKSSNSNLLEEGASKSWTIPLKRLPEGAHIKSLIFRTNGESELSQVVYESPQEVRPIHEIQIAQDAIVNMDGVRIKKPKNNELRDLVPGTELTLKKVTSKNVEISIKADDDQIIKDIKEWAKSYNSILTYIRENSKIATSKITPPGSNDRGGNLEKSGPFAGNLTVLQIISQLQTLTAQAYPSEPKGFKILSEIGISTGKLGSKWNDIQNGLLEIEDKKLSTSLNENPQGVQNLFASNLKTKKLIDNGVAFKMEIVMRPYAQISQGIISAQIDLIKNKMNANKENISRKKEMLVKKEQNLRQRFGAMQNAVKKNRNTNEYLKRAYGQGQSSE